MIIGFTEPSLSVNTALIADENRVPSVKILPTSIDFISLRMVPHKGHGSPAFLSAISIFFTHPHFSQWITRSSPLSVGVWNSCDTSFENDPPDASVMIVFKPHRLNTLTYAFFAVS